MKGNGRAEHPYYLNGAYRKKVKMADGEMKNEPKNRG